MDPDPAPSASELSDEQRVKSIETMFTIVESVLELGSARITEISEQTGLSKGAVHKHLVTLRTSGYVVKNGDRYSLGLRFLELGSEIREQNGFNIIIQSKVNQLANSTGQGAAFITEEQGLARVLYRCPGQNRMASRTRVGTPMLMHRTAAGKAMLAEFSDERVRDIIARHGLDRSTEETIVTEDALFEALERTRDRGYAVNASESTIGISAIAVPVTDDTDTLIGAFSVSGSEHLFKDAEFEAKMYDKLGSIRNEVKMQFTFS